MSWLEIARVAGGAFVDTATLISRGEGAELELGAAWYKAYGEPWPPCESVNAAGARVWLLPESGRVALLHGSHFEIRELPGRGGPTLGARIGSALDALLGRRSAPPASAPRPAREGASARALFPTYQARVRRPRER